jgi:acyl carrier protein
MKEEIRALMKDLLGKDIPDGTLELDSIDLLDVVIRVEDVYNIKIDIENLNKNTTLDEFVQVVEKILDKTK